MNHAILRRRLNRISITGLFVAAFALLAGANASAKDFLGFSLLNLDGASVHWAGDRANPIIVTYAFVDRPIRTASARNCETMMPMDGLLELSRVSQATLRAEVRAAFDMWEQVANIRFRETTDVAAAGIVIGAQEHPEGRAFAEVTPRPDHSGQIEKALICLNPRQPWKVGFDGNLAVYDLRYTIAHEIGHAIGLDHPEPTGQVMSHRYQEDFRTLQAGDIDGAVALYGASHVKEPFPLQIAEGATTKVGATRRPHRSFALQ